MKNSFQFRAGLRSADDAENACDGDDNDQKNSHRKFTYRDNKNIEGEKRQELLLSLHSTSGRDGTRPGALFEFIIQFVVWSRVEHLPLEWRASTTTSQRGSINAISQWNCLCLFATDTHRQSAATERA